MQVKDVKTADDARNLIQERDIKFVKIGIFDVDGIMRGKYMHRDKFLSALDSGFAFCDVVLGWDSNDQFYDKSEFTGWHTGYPDALVRVIPESCRELPMEEGAILFLGELEGRAETVCPRGALRRVINKASDMGYDVSAACEFEFFLFEENPHSVREKNYRNLKSITPGLYGYSILRNSVHSEFYHDLMELGESMDFPIEGLHTETGPGVLEAALTHDEAMKAADKAALFKTFTKVLAQRAGWMATFMARLSPDWPGQSGHMHISIKGKDGRAAFYDANKPHNMSDEMRWFLGGQQKLMPEMLSMVACTVNSYSRLAPGFWAPSAATWGIENRTTALRVIPGSAKSQRIEYRIAAADINPYIALSAAVGSGLWGIENKIEPGDMVVGNAYVQKLPDDTTLPATLYEAAGRLRKSNAAKSLFGEEFVTHYAQSREWEEREFRKAITDWELKRYFEII